MKIKLNPDEDEIKDFLYTIKIFGKIIIEQKEYKYKFRKCPNNIKNKRKYIISGENENIITYTEGDFKWIGINYENEFKKAKLYKWKIKILKSKFKNIMFGVAHTGFDINESSYTNMLVFILLP